MGFLEGQGSRRTAGSIEAMDLACFGIVEEAESVTADTGGSRLGDIEASSCCWEVKYMLLCV